MPHRYRDDLLELCEDKLKTYPDIERSQMMGHPGWRLVSNNKFFLMIGEDGLIVKMPPDKYDEALARDDVEAFNPMNAKPLGTWVEWIKPDAPEYHDDWTWFVHTSLETVAAEPPNKARKKKKK
ncbi:hypothetical protein KQI52_10130 [bacterium]|nr:hypothetical protein [bacterium]